MASSAWIVAAKMYETERLLRSMMTDLTDNLTSRLIDIQRRSFWLCVRTEPMLIDFGWRYWDVPVAKINETWVWRSALTPPTQHENE